MIVVSDASPVMNLAAIGRIDLLRILYGGVLLPEAVYREITAFEDQPGAREAATFEWMARQRPVRSDLVEALRGSLDGGEAEAIALAVEVGADLLLIDERAGREAAERLGVNRTGLLGVLLEAKGQGLVREVRPLLNALRTEAGFWISSALYESVLRQASE